MKFITLLLAIVLGFSTVNAQILVEDGSEGDDSAQSSPAPAKARVGKKAASEYFSERKSSNSSSSYSSGSSDRYLTVHIGGFLNDKQHRWGPLDREDDVGNFLAGVTYRIGEWVNSMDLMFRAELSTYEIGDKNPSKLSMMPMIVFPDAASEFPLYFGAGIGGGIFFSQYGEESDLSLDYQLITGVRVPHSFQEGTGIMFEVGYKGHVHILSSGQFEGTYAAVGAVFQF